MREPLFIASVKKRHRGTGGDAGAGHRWRPIRIAPRRSDSPSAPTARILRRVAAGNGRGGERRLVGAQKADKHARLVRAARGITSNPARNNWGKIRYTNLIRAAQRYKRYSRQGLTGRGLGLMWAGVDRRQSPRRRNRARIVRQRGSSGRTSEELRQANGSRGAEAPY